MIVAAENTPTVAREIRRKLHRTWRRERWFVHVRGVCYLLLWAVALTVLDLLLDWQLHLAGWARSVLLTVSLAVLAAVVYLRWLRYLRPFDPVRLALQVERQHPQLRSLLVSYVQFSGAGRPVEASPALLEAMRQQAIEATAPLDFRRIVHFNELKRIALVAVGVTLLSAATSVRTWRMLSVFARRMINPTARVTYPTRTWVLRKADGTEHITGDETVRQGDSKTVEVYVGGEIPDEGTIYVRARGGDGQWERLAAVHDAGTNRFSYFRTDVQADFEYKFRVGDTTSGVYGITVIPPPRVVARTVTLEYPAYMALATKTDDVPKFSVPEGTKIRWHLRTDVPLGAATLLLINAIGEKREQADVTLDADGKGGAVELVARRDLSAEYRNLLASLPPGEERYEPLRLGYSFRWTDKDHGYRYDELPGEVIVEPDQRPKVDLIWPTEDQKATRDKALRLEFSASDDHGLAEAWIVYSVNEGEGAVEKQRYKLPGRLSGRGGLVRGEWKLLSTLPNLKEGDTVTYTIEVSDNRLDAQGAPRPNVRRWEDSRRLYIVDKAEYLVWFMESREAEWSKIQSMHAEEKDASGQVKRIRGATDSQTQPASAEAP